MGTDVGRGEEDGRAGGSEAGHAPSTCQSGVSRGDSSDSGLPNSSLGYMNEMPTVHEDTVLGTYTIFL